MAILCWAAKNSLRGTAGVADTGEKFIAGVVGTAEQFFGGVVDTGDKF
jgi:hypothetical protein